MHATPLCGSHVTFDVDVSNRRVAGDCNAVRLLTKELFHVVSCRWILATSPGRWRHLLGAAHLALGGNKKQEEERVVHAFAVFCELVLP